VPTPPAMMPFEVGIADSQLDDLRGRLERARWPAELPGSGWDYGTEQAFLKVVVDRWVNGYDWRRTESELNSWGSCITIAAGQRVHLLHRRSSNAGATPLVLIHGWPGSIIEFLDVLPLLRERFHVVVVSMPGYGFSGPTRERGVDTAKVAAAVDEVMAQLGYDRYVAQGGDWGALVVRYLGQHHASRAVAIHTNLLFAPVEPDGSDVMSGVTESEVAAILTTAERMGDGSAYLQAR
jgi:epoxide hydrolase